jgi:NTE family protein
MSRRVEQDLARIGIFDELPPAERAELVSQLETMLLHRGELLVRQGDVADALYYAVSGRFEVLLDGRADVIAEIGPGSPIGEIAFLAGGRRTATVRAARDSIVLKLGRQQFDQMCARSPALWRSLTAALARRLADQTAGRSARSDPRPRTIALIRAGDAPVPDDFIRRFRDVLARDARVAYLDDRTARRLIGPSQSLASPEATALFNALEGRNDFVLYVADSELTAWSERVIRQADLIVRIGVHAVPGSGPIPQNALERLADNLVGPGDQRLVLLHPRRETITGTTRWLSGRRIGMHHHVAMSEPGDIERLCRFVKGTALGLVACGGGAFCAAHVGLYKACLEAGISFDIMGGTSGGSAMAAAFACGHAPETIDAATHAVFVAGRALKRYTWPLYSIVDHTHFDRLLEAHYGGIAIEDLWIPYFAISTNLSSYAVNPHLRGELWSAIRASGAIPGLLPPYYTDDGQMLVDGCLLDNVPIRTMRELKQGPNIIVAFEIPQLGRFDVDYRQLPSRGELLKRKLMPFYGPSLPAAPHIGTVLLRSLMANRQDFERYMRPDDLLLVPPLPPDMGVLDWHRHSELMQDAYAWARSRLGELREQGHPVLAQRA